MTNKLILPTIMKIIVGIVFIISAFLKTISLGAFELYIFSFEWFNLSISAIIARIIVGAELCLGLAYILNFYHKTIFRCILAMLVGFTLLLLYFVIIGNKENCHCFGDIVDISPLESIIKNILLLIILFFSRKGAIYDLKLDNTFKCLFLAFIFAIPTIARPPASIMQIFSDSKINEKEFYSFLEKIPDLKWGENTNIICIYGPTCKYCVKSAELISDIIKYNELDHSKLKVFMWGNKKSSDAFFEASNSIDLNLVMAPADILLNISYGSVPTIIVYDKEKGYETRSLNTLSEKELKKLLKKLKTLVKFYFLKLIFDKMI